MNTERRREINQERGQTLKPEIWAELSPVLTALEVDGFYPFICQALRTAQQQDALYAQGRKPLDDVNYLRTSAGLDPILDDENRVVTNSPSGSSYHELGRAVDICSYADGQQANFDDLDLFKAIWGYLEKKGWRWGHNFSHPDDDHFEK